MSEHTDQAAFVQYVLLTYRNRPDFTRSLFFAVPNGAWLGGKAPAVMNKMKQEGFLPGVADLLYLQPRGGHIFLAIEMKTMERRNQKNGGMSDDQTIFQAIALAAGALAITCYGPDEAMRVFDDYMNLECTRLSVMDINGGAKNG